MKRIRSMRRNYYFHPTMTELKQMNPGLRWYYRHRDEINEIKLHEKNTTYRQEHKMYFVKKHKEKWQKIKNSSWYKQWRSESDNLARFKLLKILNDVKCAQCGYEDIRALQVDHVNGGGLEEYRQFKNPKNLYNFYLKNPTLAKQKLQVLCANCNWIKRYENKELKKPEK